MDVDNVEQIIQEILDKTIAAIECEQKKIEDDDDKVLDEVEKENITIESVKTDEMMSSSSEKEKSTSESIYLTDDDDDDQCNVSTKKVVEGDKNEDVIVVGEIESLANVTRQSESSDGQEGKRKRRVIGIDLIDFEVSKTQIKHDAQVERKIMAKEKKQQELLKKKELKGKQKQELTEAKRNRRLERERRRKEIKERKEQRCREEEKRKLKKMREEQERERRKKEEEERRERKRKEEEERRERKRREEEMMEMKKKRQSDLFLSFFSKKEENVKKEELAKEGGGLFRLVLPFYRKEGVTLAPEIPREPLSPNTYANLLNTSPPEKPYLKTLPCRKRVKSNPMKAKFYQFSENYRPPYYGTWRKRSRVINGRRPFIKDINFLDYNYDSDEEWDEPEGDDCNDTDEGDETAECSDDDDGFFVQHGYLSEGEGEEDIDEDDRPRKREDPKVRAERLRAKADEWEESLQEKAELCTKKLVPIVYGPHYGKSDGREPADVAYSKIILFKYNN